MEVTTDWMILGALIIGMIVGSILYRIVAGKLNGIVVGTLILDMTNPDRDICRFVLDTSLDRIAKEEKVVLRITKLTTADKPLESFQDYD